MRRPDGQPLTLVERYGRMLLDPDLLAGIKGAEDWEAPHPLGHAHGELLLHDTARDLWWFPDADHTPRTEPLGGGRHRVVLTGETVIDPLTLAGGAPMEPGTHEVWASGQLLGVGRRARVVPDGRAGLAAVSVGTPPRLVVPTWFGQTGQLRLTVGQPGDATVRDRILLGTTASPRVRRAAGTVLRHLPPDVRRRARTLARRADPWSPHRNK
jgi:hypothetical protein